MRINIFTPKIERNKFSGGIYCVLKYAQGLSQKGHLVTLVAYPGSQRPSWADYDGELWTPPAPKLTFASLKGFVQSLYTRLIFIGYKLAPESIRREINNIAYSKVVPDADVSMATYWECAPLVAKHGTGKKAYFMQHYEAYFSDDVVEKNIIEATYDLPLTKIANSSWLQKKVQLRMSNRGNNESVLQCTNAVDLDRYYLEQRQENSGKTVNIISYGGRGVAWKGFAEMAAAVALARRSLPEYKINWNVYGEAALPPNNSIAQYRALGFLGPDALRRAYNQNDILLSASWYESFPLFPIEAMACGLAVISTLPGTEDYILHRENAIVVEEKNVESIGAGLIELIQDAILRENIAAQARIDALRFSWPSSIERMEHCLSKIVEGAD